MDRSSENLFFVGLLRLIFTSIGLVIVTAQATYGQLSCPSLASGSGLEADARARTCVQTNGIGPDGGIGLSNSISTNGLVTILPYVFTGSFGKIVSLNSLACTGTGCGTVTNKFIFPEVECSAAGSCSIEFNYTDENSDTVFVTLEKPAGSSTLSGFTLNTGHFLYPPAVQSISVNGTPAASATSVSYNISFDGSVQNVSADDFELTSTGSATGSIASVSSVSSSSYDVVVDNITGSGTLRLDLKGSTDISALGSMTGPAADAFSSGEVHTVVPLDTSGPAIATTAGPADGTYGVGQNLDFVFTFDEPVIVTGLPEFSLRIGVTWRQASLLSGAGSNTLTFRYTVQAGEIDSNGIIAGNLSANGGTLRDASDNDATLTFPDFSASLTNVLIETTPPLGYSVMLDQDPVSPANNSAVSFTFAGAEVGADYNYTIRSDGGAGSVDGNGTINSATQQITGIDVSGLPDGTLTLTASLTDPAGNKGPDGIDTATKVSVVDDTPPSKPNVPDLEATSDTDNSDSDNITNDTTPSFSGTAEADAIIKLYAGGTEIGTAQANGVGNWVVSAASAQSNGTASYTVTATDAAGNVSVSSDAISVTIDTGLFDNTGIERQTPSVETIVAGSSSELTFRLSFSEQISLPLAAISLGGSAGTSWQVKAISPDTGFADQFDVTLEVKPGFDPTGRLGVGFSNTSGFEDLAGNSWTGNYTGADQAYDITFDSVAPVGYSAELDQDPVTPSNNTVVSFTFSGAEIGASYDYNVTSSGGADSVDGSGTISSPTQQITGLDVSGLPDGTLTLTVSLTDTVGNVGSAATDTATKNSDDMAPFVTSITRGFTAAGPQIPTVTDEDVVSWFVQFSEDITRPGPTDFSVSGTTSPITVSSVDDSNYEISLAGGDIATVNGTVTLSFAAGQMIEDLFGNALVNTTPTGTNDNFFTMANDASPPVVQSIALQGAPLGDAASVSYLVTFDESASNITTDDFELMTSGTASGTIASVSAASGTSVTVTVNALLGAGTVRLDLKGNTNIVDGLGNGNGANGNVPAFTSGDAHTVDRTPTLSLDDVSIAEGDGGPATATFAVSLTPAPAGAVTVDFATAGGSATSDEDFSAQSGTLTFAAGETSKTINISVLGEGSVEADETALITLSNATGGAAIGDAQGQLTITNDDTAAITIEDVSGNEDDGAITLTATLNNPVQGGFTVDAATTDGTATLADNDYTEVSGQTLSFAGTTGETQTFTVTPTADMVIEPDETLSVSLSNLQNSPHDAAITITDMATVTLTSDDNAALTIEDVSGNEDDGAITVRVVLDKAVVGGFSVDVSTADGTAIAVDDYTAVTNRTLTFAGTVGETQTFTVTPTPDGAAETDETLTVSMSNIVGANASGVAISDTASVTITNDDAPMLSIDNVAMTEGNAGQMTATFTVTLSPVAVTPVSVDFATANGTAENSGDYTAQTSTLNFAVGEATKTISVFITGDNIVEADETMLVNLSNAVGADIADGQGMLTITNDDEATVTIADVSGNEDDGAITLTATLNNPVQGGFSVDAATADGTATVAGNDYTAVLGDTLNFVGTQGETQTFMVIPTSDSNVEPNETVTVSLSNLLGSPNDGAITITDTATVTINTDDSTSITIEDVTGNEDDGEITLTAMLTNAVPGGFTVDVSTVDGTATVANSDYTALTNQTLSFNGAMNETQTFTVTPTSDVVPEPDETFSVSLSNLTGVSASGVDITDSASVTIIDDDTVSFSVNDVLVTETNADQTATFTVSLDRVSGFATSVDYAIAPGTAIDGDDYKDVSGTLTFAAGETSQTVNVTVLGDQVVEPDETATFVLSNPSAGAILADPNGALTINNDDTDVTAPTVIISSTALDPVSGAFTATVTFSEPVTSFEVGDITVGNGVASNFAGSGTTYTVDITPTADGTVTLNIAAGVAQDVATNDNLAAPQFSITNDQTRPTTTLSSSAAGVVGGPFQVDIQFSERVSGFTEDDISVTNASLGGFTSLSARRSSDPSSGEASSQFSVLVTPTADGPVRIDLAGDVAQDSAGNGNIGATQLTRSFDGSAPTVSISSGSTDPVSGAFTVTVTFSEDVTGLTLGGLTVGNGSASSFDATSGSVYTALITPAADGPVTVDVAAGVAQDGAGNDNVPAPQFTSTFDGTAPMVSVTTGSPDPVAGTFPVSVTFSEPVTGFTIGGLSVDNGTPGNFVGSGASYTADITPSADGRVTVTIPGGVAQDAAGNGNLASTGFSIDADGTAPSVDVSSDASVLVNGAFDVSVSFSEDITGFSQGGLSVSNGTVSGFTVTSASSYSATITPASDGSVSINVGAGVAQDRAGNTNTASSTLTREADLTAPSVILTASAPALRGVFTVNVIFSEDVSGFSASGIAVTNGSVSDFTVQSGTRYTATITPTADGNVDVSIPSAAAQDAAGNDNMASNVASVSVDLTAPTVSLSIGATGLVSGPFTVTISTSEDVTGLTVEDIAVSNALVSSFQADSPTRYSASLTPLADGAITVSVPAGAAQDAAGNASTASNVISVGADVTAPTFSLTSSVTGVVSGPFDVTLTASEDVTGLNLSDLSVTNGTASDFVSVSATVYTATITPSGDGDVILTLEEGAATDVAGNPNVASETLTVATDQTPPTVSFATDSSEVTGPFIVAMTFSEAVEGFEEGDVEVSNGTLSGFAGEGTSYSVLVTPETLGAVTLSIADGAAQDAAGNALVGDSLGVNATGGDVEVELAVTTTTGSAGDVGSAFTLSNPGTTPISFTASADQPWVDVTPSSGQIGSLGDLEFTITLNDQVDDLPAGTYVATVTVVIDDPAAGTAQAKASGSTDGLVLATVPVTVEVEERFGTFELVILSPTGLSNGSAFSYASDIAQIDGLSVPVNVGESRTRIDELLNGSYEITQSVPDGWRLESVTCTGDLDGETVVDPTTGKINVDLDAGETLSCIFENGRDDDAIRLATQRAIRNFMARRGDRLLETAPDLSTRFSERGSTEGGSFSANGTALRTQMDFRTSLSGFRNRAAQNAVGDNKDLMSPVLEGWDMWVSAEYSRVEDERVGSGIDAKFFAAQLGIDYQVKDNLILGGLVQYDWMSEEDEELAEGVGAVAGAQVEGDGFMVGPYGVWQVSDTLVLDAMGLWGTSDNTVNPLGYYEDAFETTRFLLRANATGQFNYGAWTLRPQLTWSHYEDEQDAYIDSLGIDIPSQTVTIGRLRAGPELLWTHAKEGGAQIQLGGAIRANWDYDGPGLLDQAGRLSDGGSSLRADGDLLLGLRLTNGLSLRAKVGIDGIGKGKFDAKSGRLELSFPFGGAGRSSGVAGNNPAFDALNMAWTSGDLDQTALSNDTLASRRRDPLEQFMRGANSNF